MNFQIAKQTSALTETLPEGVRLFREDFLAQKYVVLAKYTRVYGCIVCQHMCIQISNALNVIR